MNIYGKSLVVWKKNTIFAPKIRKAKGYSPSYDNSTRCAYHQNCRRVIS